MAKTIQLPAGINNWFSLAESLYGNQRFFAQLMRANPGISTLRPGVDIKLPNIDRTKDPVVSFDAMVIAARQTQQFTDRFDPQIGQLAVQIGEAKNITPQMKSNLLNFLGAGTGGFGAGAGGVAGETTAGQAADAARLTALGAAGEPIVGTSVPLAPGAEPTPDALAAGLGARGLDATVGPAALGSPQVTQGVSPAGVPSGTGGATAAELRRFQQGFQPPPSGQAQERSVGGILRDVAGESLAALGRGLGIDATPSARPASPFASTAPLRATTDFPFLEVIDLSRQLGIDTPEAQEILDNSTPQEIEGFVIEAEAFNVLGPNIVAQLIQGFPVELDTAQKQTAYELLLNRNVFTLPEDAVLGNTLPLPDPNFRPQFLSPQQAGVALRPVRSARFRAQRQLARPSRATQPVTTRATNWRIKF